MHELLNAARGWIDGALIAGVGVAIATYQQAAFMATIAAGAVTALVGLIKVYDRVKYGPKVKE